MLMLFLSLQTDYTAPELLHWSSVGISQPAESKDVREVVFILPIPYFIMDFKILTNTLAGELEMILPLVTHLDQTGFYCNQTL